MFDKIMKNVSSKRDVSQRLINIRAVLMLAGKQVSSATTTNIKTSKIWKVPRVISSRGVWWGTWRDDSLSKYWTKCRKKQVVRATFYKKHKVRVSPVLFITFIYGFTLKWVQRVHMKWIAVTLSAGTHLNCRDKFVLKVKVKAGQTFWHYFSLSKTSFYQIQHDEAMYLSTIT